MRSREKLYIELSYFKKLKLREMVLKCDNFKSFAEKNNINYSASRRWFRLKTKNVPLDFIKMCLKCGKFDLWDFLDGEKIRSQSDYFIIFRKNLNITNAILLGWFISEGCITKDKKLSISQKDRNILIKLAKIIEDGFNLPLGCLKIKRNYDNTHLLKLPAVFRYYLIEYFGFRKGKKSKDVCLPRQIFESSKEIKFAFLASHLSGDGSVTYHTRNMKNEIFYVPEVIFSTSSEVLKNGLYKLLKSLDYNPYIQYNKKYKSYNISLVRYYDILKSYIELSPYFIDNEKTKKYQFLLSQFRIINFLKNMKTGKEESLVLKEIIKKLS